MIENGDVSVKICLQISKIGDISKSICLIVVFQKMMINTIAMVGGLSVTQRGLTCETIEIYSILWFHSMMLSSTIENHPNKFLVIGNW